MRLATLLVDDRQIDRAKPILDKLKSTPDLEKTAPQVAKELQSLQERLDKAKSTSARTS